MKRILTLGVTALLSAPLLGMTMNVSASPADAALIQKQSQEFSDASAAGDAAVLARYLDDNVIFMVENGDVITKKDIVDGAQPNTNAAMSNHLTQQDFEVKFFGDTAVTSFTDHSVATFFGQALVTNFRSTEVWKKGAKGWRMISSQTVTVDEDPPAMTLPAAELSEYVGRYQLSESYVLTISQNDSGLLGAVNGGQASPIQVELKDVLFIPGQPSLRRIMQRNAQGAIIGMVSRRQGHDIVFTRLN